MPFISGFQGLVNGWIKVNSKHVVITNTTADTNMDVNSHASTRRGVGKSENDSQEKSTFGRRDPEVTAIRKYNSSKRNRRKLERSVSLTDLLREMASEKEKEPKHQSREKWSESVADVSFIAMKNKAPVAATVASDIDVSNEGQASNAASKDDHSIDSFRFVAGFFGADIPPPAPPSPFAKDQRKQPQPQHQQHLIPMGHPQHPRIINTNAKWSPTVAGHKQSHQYDATRHIHRSSIEASMGDATSIRSTHRNDLGSNYIGDGGGALQMGAAPPPPSLRGTPPLHPIGHQKDNDSRSKQSNPMQQFFKNLPGTNKRCGSCDDYENRLLAMAADMDYLRSQALCNEYTCRDCRHEPSSQQQQQPHLQLSDVKPQQEVVVSTSSNRLAEIEMAHLKQMEVLTQDMSRGQQTMHYKLSTFATIAKDLNEESAMRKQEALKLEDDLIDVKAERDSMALELDQLRAAAKQHQVERMDHEALKETVRIYEKQGLGRAKEMVDQRGSTISDLSSKLERAIGIVEIERMKQRQRRQIIFPSRSSHPAPSALHPMPESSGATDTPTSPSLDEQLRLAKEQAHIAQMKFELSQADAARTAAVFRSRVDQLERRLDLVESPP